MDAALSAAKLRLRPILMTAFAFILGVVPLLTASGAGAEARKVMGMAVFSGMLIATILGVLLIPMLYVAVGRVIGREAGAAAVCRCLGRHAGCRTRPMGTTEMHRGRPALSPGVRRWRSTALLVRCAARGPTIRGPRSRIPRNTASWKAPTRHSRWPTRPGGRCSTIRRCRRSFARRSRTTSIFSCAVARSKRRAIPRRCRQVRISTRRSMASLATAARQASNTPATGRIDGGGATTRRTKAAGTVSNCRGRSISSTVCAVSTKPALALVLASEQGRRGVLVTLVSDVAANYFLLQSSICSSRSRVRRFASTTKRSRYFQDRLDGGVSNRLELDRIQAIAGARTAADHPDSSSNRSPSSRTPCRCCSAARRPGADVSASAEDRAVPPPIPAGLPASLIERRPDVLQAEQFLVAANADIGVAQGAMFFPTISLTGFLGGVSGDLTKLSRRRRRGCGQWAPGLLQPVVPGRAPPAGISKRCRRRYDEALATYREGCTQRLPRSGQRAGDDFRNSAEVRVQRQVGVTALVDASRLARVALRFGPPPAIIEILTADQDLFQQQLLLAQVRGLPSSRARARTLPHARGRLASRNQDNGWRKKTSLIDKAYLEGTDPASRPRLVRPAGVGESTRGLRVIVLFEGRDAAGKGGTIKAITERVSPRVFRTVALPAPSDREKTQMYMQR